MVRLASFLSLITLTACGARQQYRHDHVGTGYVGAGGVKVEGAGIHRIDWAVQTPRALRLAWTVDCGGLVQAGVAGETFEAYQARRVAEIRAERERQKKTISAIGGAVLGTVGAGAVSETAHGEARVDVAVDGEGVGRAVADGVISDDVRLPPGDLGAASYTGQVTLTVDGPAECTMTIAPEMEGEDGRGVTGQFRVVRVVDVGAERAAANARVRAAAITVRGTLQAGLVARGADPELQARLEAARLAEASARAEAERQRRDAEARARAEIEAEAAARRHAEWQVRRDRELAEEARRRAEIEARLRLEAEVRARVVLTVVATRESQLAYLVGVCGASPEAYHARIEAEARARAQAELELRLRLEAQAEARARAEAEAQARADAEARLHAARIAERERRRRAALAVRGDVLAHLQWLGAIEKPPMPAPMYEDTGEPPMSGATWVAGEWSWQGGAWIWLSGGWTIPDDGFSVSVSVDNDPRPAPGRTIVVDHDDVSRPEPAPRPEPSRPERTIVVDHRDDPPPARERPRTRDHRDDDDDDKKERVKVRDHR